MRRFENQHGLSDVLRVFNQLRSEWTLACQLPNPPPNERFADETAEQRLRAPPKVRIPIVQAHGQVDGAPSGRFQFVSVEFVELVPLSPAVVATPLLGAPAFVVAGVDELRGAFQFPNVSPDTVEPVMMAA